jgi:hypothetical protein
VAPVHEISYLREPGSGWMAASSRAVSSDARGTCSRRELPRLGAPHEPSVEHPPSEVHVSPFEARRFAGQHAGPERKVDVSEEGRMRSESLRSASSAMKGVQTQSVAS